jgi:peptide/nickel transport system substrate-binding protein
MSEPRSLDPANAGNTWGGAPVVGNALYGQLMIDDPETGDIEYRIAKSFTTDDGGTTFTLVLRDGIMFSDGTPLTADDVKATWDHAKDPATASNDGPQVSAIESVTVVDQTTVELTLTSAVPTFANSIIQTGLNWITSAKAIASGPQGMDARPVGAGPYTLEKFARQDVIRLTRNDSYYDAGKPYLDTLEVRVVQDPEQRWNIMSSEGADVSLEGQALNIDRAEKAGLQAQVLDWGGGSNFAMNTTKAPFDDVRARQAFAAAIDLQQIDDALNQGTGTIPTTLFPKSSPYFSDVPLITKDPAKAQKLLDEIAADGKPLSFTLSVFPGSGTALGNSIQTQLSTLKNVEVKIKTIDIAAYGQTMATKDYDMITNSVTFGVEPEPRLWAGLHGSSGGNYTGLADPQLDAALDTGLTSTDRAERKAAYAVVQQRLVDTVPMVFWANSVLGVVASDTVGGLQQYGAGSVLPETLWIAS